MGEDPSIPSSSSSQMSEDDDRSPPFDLIDGQITSNKARNCSGVSGSSGSGGNSIEYSVPYSDQVLENVLENVLCFLTSRSDRNAASLVCKSWYRAEALTDPSSSSATAMRSLHAGPRPASPGSGP
ncbi:transport inhibitor response 1-like protein [Prunus yedoensis var. nudiflora]|uniref:Transport inhibitor response 1-like protein n=1 Tax=Prunus yedoensis var. nudiflora TaxID=2094558 RepID=A0A314XF34_PRUYE|nr:transport inhibitor response 1-like protein [Prunus yedoensis var. nudiflora]